MKNLSSKIYHLTTVLEDYCRSHQIEAEEVANIYPIVNYLYKNVDEMHYKIMGYEEMFEN